jgi:N-methylhydantoinase A
MVNIRLSARGIRQKLKMPAVASGGSAPEPRAIRKVCLVRADQFEDCPVYARDTLPAGTEIEGPALIEEYGSTTVMFAGDRAKISETGEIIITLGAGQ